MLKYKESSHRKSLGLKIVKKMWGANENFINKCSANNWLRRLNKTSNMFDLFLKDPIIFAILDLYSIKRRKNFFDHTSSLL